MKSSKFQALLALALLAALTAPEFRPVTLALAGDLMLGRGLGAALAADADGKIFADLRPWLTSADLAFGNLESPVAGGLEAGGPRPGPAAAYNLCAPAGNLPRLQEAGFDVLSLANNHNLDCRFLVDGAGENLTGSLVSAAGMRPMKGDFEPLEISVRGVDLVFLAGDDVSGPVDAAGLEAAVRAARAGGALVIVSMHWGMEYQGGESARQRQIAAGLARAGAALIIGHHPHVIQPVECLPGKDGRGPTLVLYSLGNALFDQRGLASTRRGLLAMVRLSPAGEIGYTGIPFTAATAGGARLLPEEQDRQITGVCR